MKTFSEAMHLIDETIASEEAIELLEERHDSVTMEIIRHPDTHALIDAFIRHRGVDKVSLIAAFTIGVTIGLEMNSCDDWPPSP